MTKVGGYPKGSVQKRLPLLVRLARKSEQQGECLVWTGRRDHHGYGVIVLPDHSTLRAHRAAWIERHGMPPAATPYVLHFCESPACWRDEHLFLGTVTDKNRHCVRKGRNANQKKTHCPHGHAYTEANTGIRRSGSRYCRKCAATRSAAWRRG